MASPHYPSRSVFAFKIEVANFNPTVDRAPKSVLPGITPEEKILRG
jgi:hypothetical protein